MSNTTHTEGVNLGVRIPLAQRERVDLVARHCGIGRSEFVRLALDFTDAAVVLDACTAMERSGALTADQQEKKFQVVSAMDEIVETLRPQPLEI